MYIYNLIARGLITDNDHILLVRSIEQGHAFLPGGHVEVGESIANSLLRELREELGIIDVEQQDFLGVFECTWGKSNNLKHEINFIFFVKSPTLNISSSIVSKEKHIEFFWHPLMNLNEVNILPASIDRVINNWLANPSCNKLISVI